MFTASSRLRNQVSRHASLLDACHPVHRLLAAVRQFLAIAIGLKIANTSPDSSKSCDFGAYMFRSLMQQRSAQACASWNFYLPVSTKIFLQADTTEESTLDHA
jgi:hypothetical protein